MEKGRNILIYSNDTLKTHQVETSLSAKLIDAGFKVKHDFDDSIELIICIGGDGTFLEAVHALNFPDVPFIGINTGHLGFFQEIMPDQLDTFIDNYEQERYTLQPMQTVKALVVHDGITDEFIGLNEFIVKSEANYSVHLNISIGGSFIEKFSGDGILISTPAGSTAYNYSLGGSIVDPRLKLLQVTPIAPMNTTAYRSFTSSILLPTNLTLGIVPDEGGGKGRIAIAYDGTGKSYDNVDSIEVMLSDITVKLMRFENYDFWNKVKSKFI